MCHVDPIDDMSCATWILCPMTWLLPRRSLLCGYSHVGSNDDVAYVTCACIIMWHMLCITLLTWIMPRRSIWWHVICHVVLNMTLVVPHRSWRCCGFRYVSPFNNVAIGTLCHVRFTLWHGLCTHDMLMMLHVPRKHVWWPDICDTVERSQDITISVIKRYSSIYYTHPMKLLL